MSILRRLFKPKKVIEERAIPKPVTEPTEPEQPPVERLLSQLQDRSSDVRAAAARKLGYIGDNQSVEPMIAALRDEIGGSDDVQIALSEAIKKIDPTALERFTTKFSGWGWQVTPDLPGIKKLMRCTQKDILGSERETLLSQVLKELKSAKRQGSNALAQFMDQLIHSRSRDLIWALSLSQKVVPTPELLATVRSVLSTPQLRLGHDIGFGNPDRFDPEIIGAGKIGWTDETYERTKTLATQTLKILSK